MKFENQNRRYKVLKRGFKFAQGTSETLIKSLLIYSGNSETLIKSLLIHSVSYLSLEGLSSPMPTVATGQV